MSIARAFTTRAVKRSLALADADRERGPQRSNTTTKGAAGSVRNKISGPIELIHTTNLLSYSAPDLYPPTASSTSSSRSDDDLSDSAQTNASSPPTSPDVSPQRSMSPEPNHLSCYFTAPGQAAPQQQPAVKQEIPAVTAARQDAPVIPQRAPSHTKKASYEALNRQRSVSRLSEQSSRTVSTKASFTFSRSSSASTSTTATSHLSTSAPSSHKMSGVPSMPPPPSTATLPPPQVHYQHKKDYRAESHPFGQELAQVTEIAEEYGVRERLTASNNSSTGADDAEGLSARGLFKFSAEDYMAEIQGLLSDYLREARRPQAALWI